MPHPILDLPMDRNDAQALTIRHYMIKLVRRIITQQEGFSGKRPFGNSDWISDLYLALVKAGELSATKLADGSYHITPDDQEAADKLLAKAALDL